MATDTIDADTVALRQRFTGGGNPQRIQGALFLEHACAGLPRGQRRLFSGSSHLTRKLSRRNVVVVEVLFCAFETRGVISACVYRRV
jgi:hypothetical protein